MRFVAVGIDVGQCKIAPQRTLRAICMQGGSHLRSYKGTKNMLQSQK